MSVEDDKAKIAEMFADRRAKDGGKPAAMRYFQSINDLMDYFKDQTKLCPRDALVVMALTMAFITDQTEPVERDALRVALCGLIKEQEDLSDDDAAKMAAHMEVSPEAIKSALNDAVQEKRNVGK